MGKGFGFIECEDIKAKYEKDVWLHGCQMKGYRVGHTVKFTAYLTKKGDPQAKDLKSGLKWFAGPAPSVQLRLLGVRRECLPPFALRARVHALAWRCFPLMRTSAACRK